MKQNTRKIGLLIMAFLLALSCFPLAPASAAPAIAIGSLKNAEGTAVKETWIAVRNTATFSESSLWVDVNGSFSLVDLPAGNYEAIKYWDEALQTNVFLNTIFELRNDGTTIPADLALGAPSNTVTGDFNQAGLSGWLTISEDKSNGKSFDTRVTDGKFGIYVPAGSYIVQGIWNDQSEEYVGLKVRFNAPENDLSLALPTNNVSGTLLEGSTLIDGVWLNFYNTTSQEGYGAHVTNGQFTTALPEGDYVVSGYWQDNTNIFVTLSQAFTVSGNANNVQIIVPARNVSGTLKDEDNQPVDQAWLEIANDADMNKNYSTRVNNGAFELNLPNGAYSIRGYWHNEQFIPLNEQLAVSGTEVWTLKAPTRNVTGTVKSADNQPADQVWLSIQGQGQNNSKSYDVYVRNGSFKVSLPNGTYKAFGYWDNAAQEYVQLNTNFTVNGNLTLALSEPAKNVTGTLKQGGSSIGQAWLSIRSADYTQFYNARVTSDGHFGIALPNGSYVIDGYQSEATGNFVRLNKSMARLQGSATWDIAVPVPNVNGTLKLANGTAIHGVKINLTRTEGEHTWYEAQINNGAFSLNLPDGNYLVNGYWDNQAGESIALEHLFTVSNGVASNVNVIVPNKNVQGTLKKTDGTVVPNVWLSIRSSNHLYNYRVKVQQDGTFSLALKVGDYNVDGYYSEDYQRYTRLDQDFEVNGNINGNPEWNIVALDTNVTGKLLTEDGATIPSNVYLHLYQVKQSGWYGYMVKVDNGQFTTSLPNGHYLVRGYHELVNDQEVQLGFFSEFDVNGATNVEIRVPKKNVTGTVTSSTGMATGTINMTKDGHNDNLNLEVVRGKLNAALGEGTYTINTFFDTINQKTYVLDRTLTISGSQMHTWELELPELNVQGNVTFADGSSTSNLSLQVRKVTPGNNAPSQQVDLDNGHYALSLADGDYEFVSYFSRETREGIEINPPIRFTVNGTTSFDFVLPSKNLTGTVYRPNGTDKFDSGFVILKDTANANNPTKWLQIRNDGQYGAIIPNGTYEISEIVQRNDNDGSEVRWPVVQPQTVTVVNGVADKPTLNFVARAHNVHGEVSMPDASPYKGWVKIATVPPQGGISTGYYLPVNEGRFDYYLPDGNYRIEVLFNEQGTETLNTSNLGFTVTNGSSSANPIQIQVIGVNVKGSVVDATYQPVSGGSIMVQTRTADNSTDDRGFLVEADGTFGLALEPGTYYLMSYRASNGTTYLLPGDAPLTVTEQTQNLPPIVLQNANVQGTFETASGVPNQDRIDVRVFSNSGNGTDKFYSFMVENGQFRLFMPDGNYTISGYFNTVSGTYVAVLQSFQVVNGVATPNIKILSPL